MTKRRSSRSLRALKRNGVQQATALNRDGLLWLDGFRWLRARELALLLWPAPEQRAYALKSAESQLRKWRKSRWVIVRKLPVREAGRAHAYVLSDLGAEALSRMVGGRPISSGENWGRQHLDEATGESVWQPPGTWQHELLHSSLLALVRARWWPEARVMPERVLRRYGANKDNVPDGLVCIPLEGGQSVWLWLEIERARKSGAYMNAMADKLIAVATQSDGVVVCETPSGEQITATAAALACVVGQRDERDHAIHHGSRVLSALQRRSRRDLRVMLFGIEADVYGVTVEDVDVGWYTFRQDALARGVASLEWHTEGGVRMSQWGRLMLAFWKRSDPGAQWGWSVSVIDADRHSGREPEDVDTGSAPTSKAAQRAVYEAALAQPLRYHPRDRE
jgi:hypothetical protein